MKPAGALQSCSAQPERSIRELDRKVYAQKISPRVEDGEIQELRGIQSGGGLQSYGHRFSLVACPFALYTAPSSHRKRLTQLSSSPRSWASFFTVSCTFAQCLFCSRHNNVFHFLSNEFSHLLHLDFFHEHPFSFSLNPCSPWESFHTLIHTSFLPLAVPLTQLLKPC